MTTIHLSFLKDSTLNRLFFYAEEYNKACRFQFGSIEILYFTDTDYKDCRWRAYRDGMEVYRSNYFANLAMFLNSTMREEMDYCVILNCWIENY